MPGGDRTGPMGAGPMTGRGMGICAETTPTGLGCGRSRGMGRRFSRTIPAPATGLAELKVQLAGIQRQIDALEGQE